MASINIGGLCIPYTLSAEIEADIVKASAPVPAAVASKPRRALVRLYVKAQTFERLPLFHIPPEDAYDGANDADEKYNINDERESLNEQMAECEAILARAVDLRQRMHKVPIVTFHKKAPKHSPDENWTCSKCPGEHFSGIADHLWNYHGVGVTDDEWEAKRAGEAEAGAKSVFEMMAKYGRVGAHFIPHDAKEIPVAQRRTWEEFKAAGRPIGLFK
jgi:hypothetical protein